MNIFYLSRNPETAAEYMCDKHVVKMVLETAQLLSTAHRILDGREITVPTTDKLGRKRWKSYTELPDSREDKLYKATHPNHPCAVWVRQNAEHYRWLYRHFKALCSQYTLRYGKTHASARLQHVLQQPPHNTSREEWKEPPQAMPEEYQSKVDTVTAYRQYYIADKAYMAKWTRTPAPVWWSHSLPDSPYNKEENVE